jgi:hypothetical protein
LQIALAHQLQQQLLHQLLLLKLQLLHQWQRLQLPHHQRLLLHLLHLQVAEPSSQCQRSANQ